MKRYKTHHHVIILCGLLISCGSDKKKPKYNHDQPVGELQNTHPETIKKFLLEDSDYQAWTATTMHDATGNSPHGKVRTFFNNTVKASLEANSQNHPIGSITVKELYENNGSTIKGYAAMVKLAEESDKNSWLFYEVSVPSFEETYGIGHKNCASCHSEGSDFVREVLPDSL